MKRSPETRVGVALFCVLVVAGCGGPPPAEPQGQGAEGEVETALVEITNGSVVLGVLPSLGGRVVMLKTTDGPNLLHSDPGFWSPPFPEPSLETPFAPWNGRIVWVGPQSGFWSQQELAPERAGAPWPPDPFNEAGRFGIEEQTGTRLRLKGPISPVTGLALEHDYEITGDRRVRMTVTATNGRETPVSWDLWPNTRVRPEGFPYVPLDPSEPPRIDGPGPEARMMTAYPHQIVDGWLAMAPGAEPEPPARRMTVKAFVRPSRGLIAFFHQRQLLLIRAEVVPVERLHPEQAFIEIYRGSGARPGGDILELEMHGPYETLAPGESTSFEQTFEVLPYDGEHSPEAHLARLGDLAP
jgi:hypothetical protein